MSAGTPAEPPALGAPLPRGRHGIPRELIVANQLKRILRATALEIADHGYAALTVTEITARAGVSRLTFYKLFDDKLDCVRAAQRAVIGRLRELIGGAYRAEPSWAAGVAATVGAVLRFAATAPEEANLVRLSTAVIAEPELAGRSQEAVEELAAALREASGAPGPALREQAAIGGAIAVVGAKLAAGEASTLPGLREELVELLLAPYLGEARAREIAAA